MSPSITKKLVPGDTAPDFATTDVHGQKIRLSKIDSKHILVVFFRYSGCPWCNLAIHRLSLEYARLQENGCSVIAFIQSDKTDVVDNIYNRHEVRPPFPIIADYEQKFYKMYGVGDSILAAVRSLTKVPAWVHSVKDHGFKQTKMDGSLFLVPAAFLINGKTQKIEKASYGTSFYDHDLFLDIYDLVYYKEL
ncbi:MAG: redoxin domain-containing protein [Candidatus Saccharimonadales bacterium]